MVKLESVRSLLLRKMRSIMKQHGHYLGACEKCRFLGPTPALLNPTLLTRSSGDSCVLWFWSKEELDPESWVKFASEISCQKLCVCVCVCTHMQACSKLVVLCVLWKPWLPVPTAQNLLWGHPPLPACLCSLISGHSGVPLSSSRLLVLAKPLSFGLRCVCHLYYSSPSTFFFFFKCPAKFYFGFKT